MHCFGWRMIYPKENENCTREKPNLPFPPPREGNLLLWLHSCCAKRCLNQRRAKSSLFLIKTFLLKRGNIKQN